MASEFWRNNDDSTIDMPEGALVGIELEREPHMEFKKRVPQAIGLIRTGDTIPYANMILESA
jgi:D-ribose pyranase